MDILPATIKIGLKTYTVKRTADVDELGNEHEVVILDCDGEQHRLSPRTTAAELEKYADNRNEDYSI